MIESQAEVGRLTKEIQQALPNDQPYLMVEKQGAIFIYDEERHYCTVVKPVPETDLWVTTIERVGQRPESPRYPLYRITEGIVNRWNERNGFNLFL